MKTNARNFIKYWLPLIVWLLVIFAASSDMMSAEHTSRFIGPFLRWLMPDISPAAIAKVQFIVRKAAHVTEYAILAALLARAFVQGMGKMTMRQAFPTWVFCTTAAALDEFHQAFVGSRTGSPIDVLIDATGAVLGLAVYWFLTRRRIARPEKWA